MELDGKAKIWYLPFSNFHLQILIRQDATMPRRHLYLSGCFNKERLQTAARHEALLPSFVWCFKLWWVVTATTEVDDVDDSRTFWMWLGFQKSSMKRMIQSEKSPLWGDTQPIFALREAFAGRSWCEHLCWRCGAWGRRLRCDGWWLGTIQSHCGLLFRKLWGKFLTWLALTSFLVWFLWVYGSNYALLQKRGGKKDGITWNPWKLPRLDDLKNKFFFYKLHFHVPEVRISSPKAQKLSLLQCGLHQTMNSMKHLETSSALGNNQNRTEPFDYSVFGWSMDLEI